MLQVVSNEARQLVEQHFQADALFWRDVYGQNSLHGAIYRERRAGVLEFVDKLHLTPGARALDVGCGGGSISVALALRGMRVAAVDPVAEMVDLTGQAATSAGVRNLVSVRKGDVRRLPFGSDEFDVAIAVGVMEWMPSFAAPLEELYRVLRPGGWLIANVDNSRALHCWIDPRMNPLMNPVKRSARRLAERTSLLARKARPSRCSPARLDLAIKHAGFHKGASRTCGFGPITFGGMRLLPDKLGVALHGFLQRLANEQLPLLRKGGDTYLILAQKPWETPA